MKQRLTRENLAEAKKDLCSLRSPGYGGFNLLYNDSWYAMSLEQKWGDLDRLDANIKAMETEMVSTSGAGI